jgi:DNA-binding transcriptional LysR family regulator
MNEKDWELLNMLHKERSITKTAKRLFFTQPTISAKIKQIEKEMGCNIVIRSVRGISFTPEGELLCQFSRRYLQDFRQIKHAMQPETTGIIGTLTIGCASIYAKYKLGNILNDFCHDYPVVNVRLHTDLSQNIYDKLCNGTIQMGIIRGDYPWSGPKFLLRRDPYCIMNATPIDLKRLPQISMIYRQADRPLQSSLHDWWTSNFTQLPHTRIEVNSLDLCMQMVCSGLGYTLLAPSGAIPTLWSKNLYDRNNQPLIRYTWLYLNEQCKDNNVVKTFCNYLLDREKKENI